MENISPIQKEKSSSYPPVSSHGFATRVNDQFVLHPIDGSMSVSIPMPGFSSHAGIFYAQRFGDLMLLQSGAHAQCWVMDLRERLCRHSGDP